MKKQNFIYLILLLFTFTLFGQSKKAIKQLAKEAPIIVQLDSNAFGDIEQMFEANGLSAKVSYQIPTSNPLYEVRQQLDKFPNSIQSANLFNSLTSCQKQLITTVVLYTDTDNLKAIKQLDFVTDAYIDEINVIQTDTLPTEPMEYAQYGIINHQFNEAYNFAFSLGYQPQGTKVGIIGTGINPNHNEFVGAIVLAFDATGEGAGFDGNGHESHVASIEGAAVNGTGIKGGFPFGKLYDLKALGSGGGGFGNWVNQMVITGIDNGCEVLNLSLAPYSEPYSTPAIEYAINHNVNMVLAAGNSGRELKAPAGAANEYVLAVGAIDKNNNRAGFSNYSSKCVYAAGVGIWGATKDNTSVYRKLSGTSQATPSVTALVGFTRDFIKWYNSANDTNITFTYTDINNFVYNGCDIDGDLRIINALNTLQITYDWLQSHNTPEPENQLIVLEPQNISLQHTSEGVTSIVYNSPDYHSTYKFHDYNNAFTAFSQAQYNDVTLYADTINHTLQVTKASQLTPEQETIIKRVEAGEQTPDLKHDIVELFGNGKFLAMLSEALYKELEINGETMPYFKRKRLKRYAYWFSVMARWLGAYDNQTETALTPTETERLNHIVKQLL